MDTQDSLLRGLGRKGQALTLHQAWAAEMAGVGLGPPRLAGEQAGCMSWEPVGDTSEMPGSGTKDSLFSQPEWQRFSLVAEPSSAG